MRVNVVMGGPSAEYDISVLSGIEVAKHLVGRAPYEVRAVVIGQAHELYCCDIDSGFPEHDDFSDPARSRRFRGPFPPFAAAEIWGECDVAFLALHGSYGEDGRFQGYLDTIGVAYTGSGVFASSLAMNKIATKFVLEQNGVPTPPYSLYGPNHSETTVDAVAERHGFPCFAKCPQSGSSKLMGRAASRDDLVELLVSLAEHSRDILVETALKGIEFSCPVLEEPDGRARPLPPVEIRPVGSSFFDYRAKYTDGACEEIVPAPYPEPLLNRIRETALRVHLLLGCRGLSRTDMILVDDELSVLELNTLPGLTAASLLPKSFAAEGGTYEQLVDKLLDVARGTTTNRGCP